MIPDCQWCDVWGLGVLRIGTLAALSTLAMLLALPVAAADYGDHGPTRHSRTPPPLLKPTKEPLIRSASNYPAYDMSCPAGQVCTVCVAGCMAGRPHVVQSRSLPLPTTRSADVERLIAERERNGRSVKPEWARIHCGNDGCTGRGSPVRSYSSHDVTITIFKKY
jgi:hypothetical protein